MQRQDRLLFLALDRNRLGAWLLHRGPDRPSVVRIVLVAAYKGSNCLRRQQPDLVVELPDPTRPVLCAAARFHRDQAGRAVGEVLQELCPCQLQVHDLARFHIDPMQLEHPLRRIHADDRSVSLHLGPSGLPVKSSLFTTWHFDAVGPRGSTSTLTSANIRGGRRPFHFPKEHRQKLHSTNPIERLHAEVKRRTNVVGIFPNEAAITRLVGAILLEQNDEWAVSRRYITLESIAPLSDGVPITLPTVAA